MSSNWDSSITKRDLLILSTLCLMKEDQLLMNRKEHKLEVRGPQKSKKLQSNLLRQQEVQWMLPMISKEEVGHLR